MQDFAETLKSFVGSGWTFPIQVSSRGGIRISEGEDDVEEAIWIVLSTAPGERRMRPEFGCRVHELTFSPLTSSTLTLAIHYVREALARWEPRVEVLDISAKPDPHSVGRLLLNVRYRVLATSNERTLVYPFYRIPEDE